MPAELISVNALAPEPGRIARAAEILRSGGLVAFPTETVYGLGANALDPAAVARIFTAKGRPATNPLIVHVATIEQARDVTAGWPETAQRLAERFWPGPLTLVLPKNATVPDVVTAGGPTVAVRVPRHPVALALLNAACLPLAAPSANRSTKLSPTRAEHVLRDLAEHIDLILDAGPTPGGLESTVLDLTTQPPRLLRPGLVSPAEIESIVGPIKRPVAPAAPAEPLRSPGLLGRHYAPRAPLECVSDDGRQRVQELCEQGLRVGWLTFTNEEAPQGVQQIVMPRDALAYAARFYAALHELDQRGVDRIVVALPPQSEDWLAIHDRLQRAAEKAR